MRMDFHTHVRLTRARPFDPEDLVAMAGAAREAGTDAFALTEHFNAHRFADMLDEIDRSWPAVGDFWDVDGVRVLPGMEVDVAEGGHVLCVGTLDAVRSVRASLEGSEHEVSFASIAHLAESADDAGALLFGAHPFRPSRPLDGVDPGLLALLDGFDVNAKDIARVGTFIPTRVQALASATGGVLVAGGDSHHPLQIGSIATVFDSESTTVPELRRQLAHGTHEVVTSPCLKTKIEAGQLIKKLLKRQSE